MMSRVQEDELRRADVRDVGERPGLEVVDADHAVTAREQLIAQMRSEEARATRDEAGGHGGGRIAERYRARAALSVFLPMSTSTHVAAPSWRARPGPALASRLHTTGHFLQRGRDLQQRFFGLDELDSRRAA